MCPIDRAVPLTRTLRVRPLPRGEVELRRLARLDGSWSSLYYCARYFTSFSVCAMMAGPETFTPQGGNSFTVKKLSGRFDQ